MAALSLERLRQIRKRQRPPRYGSEYIPSILATRDEAPSISRCTRLYSTRHGRDLHLLSDSETAAALLALYAPQVSEIQEQRMLSTTPTLHPLAARPGYRGPPLPGPRGTLEVSDRLNVLEFHPRVWVSGDGDSRRKPVGFPLVGDLLLFLDDPHAPGGGGQRCVNWNIKQHSEDFTSPRPDKRKTPEETARAIARTEIEEAYYNDAAIPTRRIADIKLRENPWRNLRMLFPYAELPSPPAGDARKRILMAYRRAIDDGTPINVIIPYLCHRLGYSASELCAFYYHAIWHRELPVDLYRPILIDRAQDIKTQDPLDVYAEWFCA
ncbi:MAG: hypothetical protein EOM26_09045 [Alphaproteobacteria bacterium]|nr:hypothetical protein [Alphaproteobacteria bacterium]